MSFYRRSLFSPRRFSSAESKAGMPGVCFTSVARSFSCFTSGNALMTWNSSGNFGVFSFFFLGGCFGNWKCIIIFLSRKERTRLHHQRLPCFFQGVFGQVSRFTNRFDTVTVGSSFGLFKVRFEWDHFLQTVGLRWRTHQPWHILTFKKTTCGRKLWQHVTTHP